MQMLELLALALGCYLWGSISPAQWAALHAGHTDLRCVGSGSVGGSNVGEQLGLGWLAAVGAADVLKGALPVLACRVASADGLAAVIAGLAATAGHNWSAYLGLKGGRGVATTLGAVAIWDWRLAGVFVAALAAGLALRRAPEATLAAYGSLLPAALTASLGSAIAAGCVAFVVLMLAKRLEANALPLPTEPDARRAVLARRLVMDRDVPRDQPWQERKQFG